MGGGPPSRIPPYIGVVDKKRGDNPVKEILGKIFWEVGVPLEHPTLCGIISRSGIYYMGGGHMVIKNTVREHDPPSCEGTLYVKKKFWEKMFPHP
jgi:hypothetical protein